MLAAANVAAPSSMNATLRIVFSSGVFTLGGHPAPARVNGGITLLIGSRSSPDPPVCGGAPSTKDRVMHHVPDRRQLLCALTLSGFGMAGGASPAAAQSGAGLPP